MMRRKFDVDLTEQNVFTEREVHDLTLQKDNVSAYLITLDSLLMEVAIDDSTLEVIFCAEYGTQRAAGRYYEKVR